MQDKARPRRVLALSSQVAVGHVGLAAAVPVLQRLGVPVTALPTVMLSNHPGWAAVAGHAMPVADLQAMIDALSAAAADAGVAALCARTAVLGADLNVLIIAKELTDAETARSFVERGADLRDQAIEREAEILEILAGKL